LTTYYQKDKRNISFPGNYMKLNTDFDGKIVSGGIILKIMNLVLKYHGIKKKKGRTLWTLFEDD